LEQQLKAERARSTAAAAAAAKVERSHDEFEAIERARDDAKEEAADLKRQLDIVTQKLEVAAANEMKLLVAAESADVKVAAADQRADLAERKRDEEMAAAAATVAAAQKREAAMEERTRFMEAQVAAVMRERVLLSEIEDMAAAEAAAAEKRQERSEELEETPRGRREEDKEKEKEKKKKKKKERDKNNCLSKGGR